MTRQQMLDRAAQLEAQADTAMGYWRRDLSRDPTGAGWAQEQAMRYRAAADAFREAAESQGG